MEGAVEMNSKPLFENRPEQGSTKCTFKIEVRFLQNTTWQGSIHWIEGNQKRDFRSALEMLKLMDEALTDTVEDMGIASWNKNENNNNIV